MDNFRMSYDRTCTITKIVDRLETANILKEVNYPTYGEILEALSINGYFCYAEPVDTMSTLSGIAWYPVLVYRSGDVLNKAYFPDMCIEYCDAIDESIGKALDIILDKKSQQEYGKH